MLTAVIQMVLCALLVVVSGNEAAEGAAIARFPRGVSDVIAQILKTATLVAAKNQKNTYKKPGGTAQAMKDFYELVPTPAGTQGATRWGDVGNKRIILQNKFGRPVLSIRDKGRTNSDVTKMIIHYMP